MRILPAIDLFGGKCVRLYKGNYDEMTVYSEHPEEIAKEFQASGASHIHLVDLEGAKSGLTPNIETVKKIMADILNIEIEKINNDSHFIFELGGSSLEYLTLLMEIKNKFEVDLNFNNKSCSNALEFSEFISEALQVKELLS